MVFRLSTGVGASIAEKVATKLFADLPGNQGTVVTIASGTVRARHSARGVAMGSVEEIGVEGYLNAKGIGMC